MYMRWFLMQIQNQGDQYYLDWNIANDQFQN